MHRAWYDKRKKPEGGYYHFVKWYDEQGKQRAKSFPTKVAAEQFRVELVQAMNRGETLVAMKKPWDELVREYLDYHRKVKGSSAGTLDTYEDSLNAFRDACGQQLLSTQIAHRHVAALVAARRQQGAKGATINKNLREIRAFFSWCRHEGYMGPDRIRWKELWQTDEGRPLRIAAKDEMTRLLQAALKLYGPCWYVRIVLAMTTGLRRSDIEHIRVSEINLQTGTMPTRNQKARKRFEFRPIHPVALRVLQIYIPTLPAGSDVLLPDPWHDTKWDRIKKEAGVQNLMYHDLRKSFASYLLMAGFSTAVVQDLLEHSTPNLTHDIYSKVNQIFPKAVASFPMEEITDPEALLPPASPPIAECPASDSEPHAD